MSAPDLPELPPSLSQERLREFATAAFWYHTLEFPHGIRTAGVYQHRPYLHFYGFPSSLAGEKVLDVGAADGFFSFEFERRGAAEVWAVDNNPADGSVLTDVSAAHRHHYLAKYESMYQYRRQFQEVYDALGVPVGHNFLASRAIIESQVKFLDLNAYELISLQKQYDLVFCGDLIEHLKNPLAVLENLVSVTGRLCIISLSNVFSAGIAGREKDLGSWRLRALRHFARIIGLPMVDLRRGLEYHGNDAGGSFFHFYPETFKQALLASGFKRVEIYSYFDLPNIKYRTNIAHAIYHCYV